MLILFHFSGSIIFLWQQRLHMRTRDKVHSSLKWESTFQGRHCKLLLKAFQKLITALEKQDKEILTETEFVQPAVYLVEASLMEKLPSPSLVLGHSSGEYAALVEPEFGMFELDLKS